MARRNQTTVAGQLGADPTLPDVSIILGGKKRRLCFDFNAVVLASKATGVNLLRSMVDDWHDPETLRGLLWAALVRDEPELTLEQVGDLIRPVSVPGIRAALLSAWFESAGESDGSGKGGGSGEAKAQAKTV